MGPFYCGQTEKLAPGLFRASIRYERLPCAVVGSYGYPSPGLYPVTTSGFASRLLVSFDLLSRAHETLSLPQKKPEIWRTFTYLFYLFVFQLPETEPAGARVFSYLAVN